MYLKKLVKIFLRVDIELNEHGFLVSTNSIYGTGPTIEDAARTAGQSWSVALIMTFITSYAKQYPVRLQEDLIQEAVARVVAVWHTFDPSLGWSAKTYYGTVAKRAMWRFLKLESRMVPATLVDAAGREGDPSDLAALNESVGELDRAMGFLSPRLREMVRMRYSGCRLDEVGAAYGITGERVRQLVLRALRTLRRRLC